MMIKVKCLLALSCFILGLNAHSQAWKDSLPATLDGLARDYYLPTVTAAFGTFTYSYTGIPTPFSRFLEESLADAAARSRMVKLFNKSAAAAMDPAFRAVYEPLFSANEVGALLHGRYVEEGDSIRARIELTGLNDGILIGSAEFKLPKDAIPPGISTAPVASVAEVVESLATILPAGPGQVLKLSLATERGAGAVYREGEDLVALLGLDRDAWVRVYHIDVEGKVSLIWPNRFGGGDGFLRAGTTLSIPGPGDPFSFRMTPPYGTEFLKAVASTLPFVASEADFTTLAVGSGAAREVITRGLSIVGGAPAGKAPSPGAPALAETIASYVIVPAKF
jgi:hypothetical protein